MNVLQRYDSLLKGKLLKHTFLMTGASGGMLGAAYFRELYLRQQEGEDARRRLKLYDSLYCEKISRDLLNSVFSSFAVNDFITTFPAF